MRFFRRWSCAAQASRMLRRVPRRKLLTEQRNTSVFIYRPKRRSLQSSVMRPRFQTVVVAQLRQESEWRQRQSVVAVAYPHAHV